MEEFQRAKALIQQRASEAKAKVGVLSMDAERQRQIETQQEVNGVFSCSFLCCSLLFMIPYQQILLGLHVQLCGK